MKKAIVCGVAVAVSLLFGGMAPAMAAQEQAAQAEEQQKYVESDDVFRTAGLGSGQLTGEYRLTKYDVISLNIVGFPEGLGYDTGSSSNELLIGPDGRAAIPYIGNVKLAGLTLNEAKALIQSKLSEYIRIPSMSVSVKTYGKRKIYVMGEVAKPGIQELDIDSLNAYAAITSAGGFTKRGRSTRVQVLRVIDDTMYYTQLNMKTYVKRHDLTQNVVLQDGDIVYVPKSSGIRWNEDVLPYVSAWALYKNLTD
ncbi:polysaccharide biosynthesis/export family protein [Selenomonas sp. ND2010]|uniref:polysaccharide biosynthesis/export family protein n=1 Tax=Selenomonas sp. ND2010 TaxID=1410618 RepID=UPI00051C80F8|nr:polysaccharide biosynthesis/export family protein [Selenomonas sp. ND2010]